jgi:hypothetical protein
MNQLHRSCYRSLHYFMCLVLLLTMSVCVHAQQANSKPPVYVGYLYIKTEPGKFDTYDSLLRNYTKKIFDSEVKAGDYLSWQIYEVLSPSGAQAEYNLVGVTVTTKFDLLLDPPGTNSEIFKKYFPNISDKQYAEIAKKYASSRTLVKREIYTQTSSTGDDGPPTQSPAKYVQVDFMTPQAGKRADYAKMEGETFKAIHKERIKLGALKGWVLLEKVLPGDTDDPAPFVTVNFYDDFNSMLNSKYEEAIKAAYPNSNIDKMFNEVNTVKKRQQIQVWKLMMADDKQGVVAK